MRLRTLIFIATVMISHFANAADVTTGDLKISNAHARATVPGQSSAAVYLTIENTGKTADKLTGVATPRAKSAELHTMSMDGTMMKMREVTDIALPPGAKVAMAAGGGYHVMLMGVATPLVAGQQLPVRLTFEKAAPLDIKVRVDALSTVH
ncbi:copper chaperone PCu(A)C [Actimicrobium antarcticum]|uniref:Copper chaperone PCu(A)C n=1 Tax=Actimicrobium antarcticum TaxID=1051899 RepID=A0ABP7T8M2_9BURK